MTAVFHFDCYLDLDEATVTKVAESLVATGIVQYMAQNGTPGNVMVALQKIMTGTSVANFAPDSPQPIPVVSAGTSTWIGAPLPPPALLHMKP
jgi:hypothetical protein